MRRLILQTSVSIDGYVAALDGSHPWSEGSEDDQAFKRWILDSVWAAGAHLMGRVTYEEMAGFWPTSTSEYARPMNEIPKVVFSKTLEQADWPETRIARGDLRAEIGRLKREQGNDLIAYGGATLDQALSRFGLVDEYRLMVQPAALGAGLPCSRICPPRYTSTSLKRPHTRRASPFTSTGGAQVPPTRRSVRINPNRSGNATPTRRNIDSTYVSLDGVVEQPQAPTQRKGEIQMGRLVVTEYISVDCVVEAPSGTEEFERVGWTDDFSRGPEGDTFKFDETMASDALLLGRITYETFAPVWPHIEGEFADKFNSMPKYVLSSTLKDPEWNNTTVLTGDVVDEVTKLKQRYKRDIVMHGSPQLAQTLIERDLVDALHLLVYPVDRRRRQAPVRRHERDEAVAARRRPDVRRRRSPPRVSAREVSESLLASLGSRQLVATHGNGFRLFATGCHRLRPL